MRRRDHANIATLLIDGEPAGRIETTVGFVAFISWSGLDIGRDRDEPGLALRARRSPSPASCARSP